MKRRRRRVGKERMLPPVAPALREERKGRDHWGSQGKARRKMACPMRK